MVNKKKNTFRSLYGDDIADAIAHVRIKIDGKMREFDFTGDIDINYETLQDDLIEQPAILSFWSTILSKQKSVVSTINLCIKRQKAAVFQNLIEASRASGTKIPKYELDEIVELDEKLIELQMNLIKEERKLSKLYGVVDTIKTKGDNLRSLAGFKRQEMRDS